MTNVNVRLEIAQAQRNMSAPPRSTLTLNPFRIPAEVAKATGGALTNWGLAWYARVDFDQLLKAQWPRWAGKLRNPTTSPGQGKYLRLCGAVALARIHEGVPAHPGKLGAGQREELGDELLRRAPELSRARALPLLMLVTRAADTLQTTDADPIRALAILTHLSGRTCDPGGSPLLSEVLQEGYAIDLWTAEASHV